MGISVSHSPFVISIGSAVQCVTWMSLVYSEKKKKIRD